VLENSLATLRFNSRRRTKEVKLFWHMASSKWKRTNGNYATKMENWNIWKRGGLVHFEFEKKNYNYFGKNASDIF
jgi:hypothetical protein